MAAAGTAAGDGDGAARATRSKGWALRYCLACGFVSTGAGSGAAGSSGAGLGVGLDAFSTGGAISLGAFARFINTIRVTAASAGIATPNTQRRDQKPGRTA